MIIPPPFDSLDYKALNGAELEHLDLLEPSLQVRDKSVLELGAGVGLLTGFWLSRGYRVTAIEGRRENIDTFRQNWPEVPIIKGNLDQPEKIEVEPHGIVFCYGLLYHLLSPQPFLRWSSQRTKEALLLETQVSPLEDTFKWEPQDPHLKDQAMSGWGCLPTKCWLREILRNWFDTVTIPPAQPNYPAFQGGPHPRVVIVATEKKTA
jgi:hypothetical protein